MSGVLDSNQVRRAALRAASVVAVTMSLLALPAAASASSNGASASARQPDGRIRLQKVTYQHFPKETYDRPWIGDDRYNDTGYHQAAREGWSAETPGWQQWVFGVSVQNDGTTTDSVRVQATGADLPGWTVSYYVGRSNVTSAVVAGTFTTPPLPAGGEYLIKVKVRRAEIGPDGTTLRRLITLTSTGNERRVDAVKVVMRVFTCGC